jgi:glutamine synthetase
MCETVLTKDRSDKKGYIEDRRPNANADPYVVTALLTQTICSALAQQKF